MSKNISIYLPDEISRKQLTDLIPHLAAFLEQQGITGARFSDSTPGVGGIPRELKEHLRTQIQFFCVVPRTRQEIRDNPELRLLATSNGISLTQYWELIEQMEQYRQLIAHGTDQLQTA